MSIGTTDTKMVNHYSSLNGREYIIMCTTSDARPKRAVDRDLLSLQSIKMAIRDTPSKNSLKDLCLNENIPE